MITREGLILKVMFIFLFLKFFLKVMFKNKDLIEKEQVMQISGGRPSQIKETLRTKILKWIDNWHV